MCLGLATGYIKAKKECSSGTNVPLQKEIPPMPKVKKAATNEERPSELLKTYTNYDRLKDMSIDEMAKELAILVSHYIYFYFKIDAIHYEPLIYITKNNIKKILEENTQLTLDELQKLSDNKEFD